MSCEIRMTQDSGKYDTGALIHQFRGIAVKKNLLHKRAPYCTFLYTFVCVRIVTHTLFSLTRCLLYPLSREGSSASLVEYSYSWPDIRNHLHFNFIPSVVEYLLQLKERISRSLFTFAHTLHTLYGYMKLIIIICSNSSRQMYTFTSSHM